MGESKVKTQTFAIKNTSGFFSGVTGGYLKYTADPDLGGVEYEGQITYKVVKVPGTYTIPKGKYPLSPALMRSSQVTKVGDVIPVGPATFTVKEIQPGQAKVDIVLQGQNWKGTGVLDTSGEVLQIKQVIASGSVGPLSLTVQADEAPGCVGVSLPVRPSVCRWLFHKLLGIDK